MTDVPECIAAARPGQFYTQAAGHPPIGFTQFIVKHTTGRPPWKTRSATSRTCGSTCRSGSASTPRRPRSASWRPSKPTRRVCPPSSVVGTSIVTTALAGLPSPPPASVPVYNLVPKPGRAGAVRLRAPSARNVFLKADVDWSGDYHEGFTIAVPEAADRRKILKNRLVFTGVAGNGTFLTTPSTCHDPAQAAFAAHLLDLPAGRLGRGPRPRLPQRLEPLRGRPAAGRQADRLRRRCRSNRGSP